VTGHYRKDRRWRASFYLIEFCMADTAGIHPDQNFMFRDHRYRDICHFERLRVPFKISD